MLYARSVTASDMMNGDRYSLLKLGVLTRARIITEFNRAPAMDKGVNRTLAVMDCPVENAQSVLFDSNEQCPSIIPPGQIVSLALNCVLK